MRSVHVGALGWTEASEAYPSAPPSDERGGYALEVVQVPSVAHPKSNPAMLVPTVRSVTLVHALEHKIIQLSRHIPYFRVPEPCLGRTTFGRLAARLSVDSDNCSMERSDGYMLAMSDLARKSYGEKSFKLYR